MQPKQNIIKLNITEKLKIDPYYFERKKELEKLRADVESGKEKLIKWKDFKCILCVSDTNNCHNNKNKENNFFHLIY